MNKSVLLILLVFPITTFAFVKNTKGNYLTTREIIAATIWYEAAGEGEVGIRGVASSIQTRSLKHKQTPLDVCLKPEQFICWKYYTPTYIPKGASGTKTWKYCLNIASRLESGRFEPSFYATHFYNPKLAKPKWAKKMKRVAKIGNHIFGNVK